MILFGYSWNDSKTRSGPARDFVMMCAKVSMQLVKKEERTILSAFEIHGRPETSFSGPRLQDVILMYSLVAASTGP